MNAYMQLNSGSIIETANPEMWPEAKRLSKAKGKAALRDEARKDLLAILTPGDTIVMVLRHVARSGMSRRIDFYKVVGEEFVYLTQRFAWLLGERVDNGMIVSGAGMDMGFHVVYSVGRRLWPDGFAPSEHAIRPADGKRVNVNIGRGRGAGPLTKAEVAALAAKGWKFVGGRNGDTSGWDTDGGYALRYKWL